MKYLRSMRHVALPGALALLLAGVPLIGQVASPAPGASGTPGDVQVGRRGRYRLRSRARRRRQSDSEPDQGGLRSLRLRLQEGDSRLLRRRQSGQPGDCCSTSAAAWRSAATWTARARRGRRHDEPAQRARTKPRCSRSTRSCARSWASRRTRGAIHQGQPEGQAVGTDVAV